MSDFPAAHSMDTMWFAVDDDGHVAHFETGESGAMPSTAEPDCGDLGELPVREASVIYDLAGRRAMGGEDHVSGDPWNAEHPDELLMFVRTGEDVPELPGARRVQTSEGSGLLFTHPGAVVLAAIHKRRVCLGCFPHYGGEFPIAERGFYAYAHTTDNWIAGPYARVERPGQPLRADELPDDIAAGAVRYAGRFADTPTLQPAELWQCESWEPVWLATDGKTMRPFPGREADTGDEDAEELELSPALTLPEAQLLRPRNK